MILEVLINIIVGVAVSVLSGVVLRMQLKYEARQKEREKEWRTVMKDLELLKCGLCELLGNNLDYKYEKYEAQGYCPADKKEKYAYTYKIYHEVGGNGIRTANMHKIEAMSVHPVIKDGDNHEHKESV